MDDPAVIIAIFATFLLAGAVKGVIGLGLPTVTLGLLTAVLDLTTAMALLIVPSFVTNLWQAAVGGHGVAVLRRIWPFLAMATATVWLGAAALSRVELEILSALLGLLLVLYAASGLAGFRLAIPARHEGWSGMLLGAANGALTGMTGSFVVPGTIYLQALGLPRDALIQAMGMLFTASTVALALALQGNGLLGAEQAVVSAAALLPAVIGMVAGQRVRRRLSETLFRRVFFAGILALGGYILATALMEMR